MQPSPYTPGATARDVPGREQQLQEIGGLLHGVASRSSFAGRIRVDVGPRGVGKTSLLRRAQRDAADLGLGTVFVTAGNGSLVAVLADEVGEQTRRWGGGDVLLDHVEELKVSVGVPGTGVEITGKGRPAPQATRALRRLVRQAASDALASGLRGVVLLVDEIQATAADDLRTIAYAWQELQSEDEVPAALLTAGLGHTADVVTKAVTYGERFAYRPMRSLEDRDVRLALSGPAASLGVSWSVAALRAAVERAQGYPYFVQLYGDETWRAAGYPDSGATLTIRHLDQAQERVDVDLSELYRSRWSKATPRERDLLVALAGAGAGPVSRKAVADALGVTTTALSMARQSLLDKGIIESPGHGQMAFTVPGFAEYVREVVAG